MDAVPSFFSFKKAKHTVILSYIENARLPTEKAHGTQIMKTCEALTRQGFEVTLTVPKRDNPISESDPFAYYGVEKTFDIRQLQVVDGLRRVPSCLWSLAFVLERITFVWQVRRRLTQIERADVLYTRDPVMAEALVKSRGPVVVELHDDPRNHARRWAVLKKKVRLWVVISNALRDLLMEEGIVSERICVAPDGFDDSEFSHLPDRHAARLKLRVDDHTRLFVYTGQLFPWKGWEDLASSFSLVPEGTRLVIIGGDERDRTRLLSRANEKLERVTFIPRVSHFDALTWLAAADAGILPTSAKFEIGRRFTSPLKLFEYLAAGLPMIASDVPSSHEILTENEAIFFEPDNGSSFIQALQAFLQLSSEQVARMSESARARSVEFSWRKRGERIASFIRERLR